MKLIITESQHNFIKRRLDFIYRLSDREMRDAEPCYFKFKFENNGFEPYKDSVISSMSEFVMNEIPNFFDMEEEEEIEKNKITQEFLSEILHDRIKDYYDNFECDFNNYN